MDRMMLAKKKLQVIPAKVKAITRDLPSSGMLVNLSIDENDIDWHNMYGEGKPMIELLCNFDGAWKHVGTAEKEGPGLFHKFDK